MKQLFKRLIYSNTLVEHIYKKMVMLKNSRGGGVQIHNKGIGVIRKDIIGRDNIIDIKEGTVLHKIEVRMHGNNCRLEIGENCIIGPRCSFWLEGDNITIEVGNGSTFTRDVQLCAQENNSSIHLGDDCMLSNTITIRTSDSHPIYDNQLMNRINPAKDVVIGNHVWIAPNSKVFKGVIIGNGAIIGSDSLVTKSIGSDSLAVGHPAKIVKENVKWTREKLF